MKVHRVKTGTHEYHGRTRYWWECSCGRAGSVDGLGRDVELVSDDHIDRAAGDRRIDVRETA